MELNTIIPYWFPDDSYQEFWFDGSPDEYIKLNYSKLLQREENGEFDELISNDNILSRIILLDQFTRNIYRNTNKIYKNDSKAFNLANKIIKDNKDKDFKLNHRIFILMPYRHSKNSDLLDIVLNKIEEYESEFPNNKLLNKFKMATLKSYTFLNDRIKVINNICDSFNLDKFKDIIDDNCLSFDIKNIDLVNIKNYPLYVTLKTFYTKTFPNISDRNIGISLSGGVDSMVMAYICKILESEGFINKLVMVHLEYINRDEASKESEMLQDWCAFNNIPIILRKISHMKRDSVERNFFEEETRKMRFETYKYAIKNYGINCFCLGHHYGDMGENVLMNIFKGRDILDLFVMDPDSILDGVRILRPMLTHPKKDIYEISNIFNIPYFKDSTPDWSCRGVLRRKIMPNLIDQYGEGIHKNLAGLGVKSKEWEYIINTMVIKPFLDKVKYYEDKIQFEITKIEIEQPKVFWTKIFLEVFHSTKNRMVSMKSLDSCLNMIKKRYGTSEKLKINFSNKLRGDFENNILTIFL